MLFRSIRELPDLGAAFALGDRVLVRGTSVAIALEANGASRMNAAEIKSIVAAW